MLARLFEGIASLLSLIIASFLGFLSLARIKQLRLNCLKLVFILSRIAIEFMLAILYGLFLTNSHLRLAGARDALAPELFALQYPSCYLRQLSLRSPLHAGPQASA